ncbi:LOW QUALITY PROTEIN: olfactory receptor 6B1-like [Leptosomus discolor]
MTSYGVEYLFGQIGNKIVITTFLLLEFGDIPEMQSFLFLLFLVIYVVTVIDNILIFVLVVVDQHLHKPMYFFLCSLSSLETCYSSTILPRMFPSFLTGGKSVSVGSCVTQFYLLGSLAVTESFLLSVMSDGRHLAVCKPFHYRAVMNSRYCLQLVAWSWLHSLLVTAVSCFVISHFFCGPKCINDLFCDFTPVIKLSCCDTSLTKMLVFIPSSVCALPPFLLTLVSYMWVIAVFRISSTTGVQKAFSTCFSHLVVTTGFFGGLIIIYVLPKTRTLRALNKVFSVFYAVVTTLLNLLIYSLRNREVKDALSKVARKCVS